MDKNSYALGMSIAHNMISSGVKEVAFEDFTAGLRVHRAEDVVEEVDVAILVDCTRELDALLLPAAEVEPTFADLRLVAPLHHLQVLVQAAHPDGLPVPLSLH